MPRYPLFMRISGLFSMLIGMRILPQILQEFKDFWVLDLAFLTSACLSYSTSSPSCQGRSRFAVPCSLDRMEPMWFFTNKQK